MKERVVMPSPITAHNQVMKDICAALGLTQVRSLVIRADVGEAVTVSVERFLTDEEAAQVLRVVTDHELVVGPAQDVFVVKPLESGADATTIGDASRKYVR